QGRGQRGPVRSGVRHALPGLPGHQGRRPDRVLQPRRGQTHPGRLSPGGLRSAAPRPQEDGMKMIALGLSALVLSAGAAQAEERCYAYDPESPSARLMTRAITLRVEQGWFGRVRVEQLYATAGEGYATLERGGLDRAQVSAALPADAE